MASARVDPAPSTATRGSNNKNSDIVYDRVPPASVLDVEPLDDDDAAAN